MNSDEKLIGEINTIEKYIDKYGDIDLELLIKNIQGNKIHQCPACEGTGQILHKQWAPVLYKEVKSWRTCDVCGGFGYTEKEKVPNMEYIGWK